MSQSVSDSVTDGLSSREALASNKGIKGKSIFETSMVEQARIWLKIRTYNLMSGRAMH